MPSISIPVAREQHPNKTDMELATIVALRDDYVAVVRYKAGRGETYTDFGCCREVDDIARYLTNPNCGDPQVVFDRRTGDDEGLVNAIRGGQSGVLRTILGKGANPNTVVGRVLNPLLIEVFALSLQDAVRQQVIKVLMRYGADPFLQNGNGATALEIASRHGNVGCVYALLSKRQRRWWRAAPAPRPAIGGRHADHVNVALDVACQEGHADIVKALIEHWADVAFRNEYGNTPLHSACNRFRERTRVVATVTELVSKGADIRAKNKQGETALDLAVRDDISEVAALLREAG